MDWEKVALTEFCTKCKIIQLKSSQNKKGQKISSCTEKDTENCAPGIFFGPSYFEAALVRIFSQSAKFALSEFLLNTQFLTFALVE